MNVNSYNYWLNLNCIDLLGQKNLCRVWCKLKPWSSCSRLRQLFMQDSRYALALTLPPPPVTWTHQTAHVVQHQKMHWSLWHTKNVWAVTSTPAQIPWTNYLNLDSYTRAYFLDQPCCLLNLLTSQSVFSSALDLLFPSEILSTLLKWWKRLNAERNIFYIPVLYSRSVFRYADKDLKIHYLLPQSKESCVFPGWNFGTFSAYLHATSWLSSPYCIKSGQSWASQAL